MPPDLPHHVSPAYHLAPPESGDGWQSAASPLGIRVAAGESGPVLVLSGEADITTLAQLESALSAQLAAGAGALTVDLSGLGFADSATIGALVRAARTLRSQGRRLDLASPQPALARMLALLGVDEVVPIRDDVPGHAPAPGSHQQ
jgi:anti-sigma B factor antagonist